MNKQDNAFIKQFNMMNTCKLGTDSYIIVEVLMKLRAVGDPNFKVDFHVDFSSIEFIARDVRA